MQRCDALVIGNVGIRIILEKNMNAIGTIQRRSLLHRAPAGGGAMVRVGIPRQQCCGNLSRGATVLKVSTSSKRDNELHHHHNASVHWRAHWSQHE